MIHEKTRFGSTEILLPDFSKVNGTLWATVACDQFTSEPDYWKKVEELVGNAPSTLNLTLPELYLSQRETRVPSIQKNMNAALKDLLISYPDAMIAVERVQSDGSIRHGLVGAVDLEAYDYRKGAASLIRATEATVPERIPPRVEIRKDAPLEFPHILLLIDDPEKTVLEPLFDSVKGRTPLYDFELMLEGGHLAGTLLTKEEESSVQTALEGLISPDAMKKKYGSSVLPPLLFAVGDGNHSLATAKEVYETKKQEFGDGAKSLPCRHALCEVVNLHEDSMQFEPIYRIVFNCNPADLITGFQRYAATKTVGDSTRHKFKAITKHYESEIRVEHPTYELPVETLQLFLDDYQKSHPEIVIDYIHGKDSLLALSDRENTVGLFFEGMKKEQLFKTILFDGSLPRKTFSMGHAKDKRYYVEGRKIK